MTRESPPMKEWLVDALVGNKGSVYEAVKNLEKAPTEALRPAPALNAALERLVALLQGVDCVGDFAEVERSACWTFATDAELSDRAAVVRSVAQRAEGVLESHFADILLAAPPWTESTTSETEKDCVRRVAEAGRDFPYVGNYVQMVETEALLTTACLKWARRRGRVGTGAKVRDAHAEGNEKMKVAFCGSGPLPFTGLLLAAAIGTVVVLIDWDEDSIAQSRKLVDKWIVEGVLPPNCIEYLCADAADIQFHCGTGPTIYDSNGPGGKDNFCKSDRSDQRQDEIIPSKDETVFSSKEAPCSGDVFQDPGNGRGAAPGEGAMSTRHVVQCDIVFVASLIPTDTKEKIARAIADASAATSSLPPPPPPPPRSSSLSSSCFPGSEATCSGEGRGWGKVLPSPPPILLVRSAHGLTSHLSYEPAPRSAISKHMDFTGVLVPRTHVDHLGRWPQEEEMAPLALFPRDILNSLEVYCCREDGIVSKEDLDEEVRGPGEGSSLGIPAAGGCGENGFGGVVGRCDASLRSAILYAFEECKRQ